MPEAARQTARARRDDAAAGRKIGLGPIALGHVALVTGKQLANMLERRFVEITAAYQTLV